MFIRLTQSTNVVDGQTDRPSESMTAEAAFDASIARQTRSRQHIAELLQNHLTTYV